MNPCNTRPDIVLTSRGLHPEAALDPRFRGASFLAAYWKQPEKWLFISLTTDQPNSKEQETVKKILDWQPSCIITGYIGLQSFRSLARANIKIYTYEKGSIIDCVHAALNNTLPLLNHSNALDLH